MSVPGGKMPPRIAALPPPQVRQELAKKADCIGKRPPEAGQLGATSPQQSLKHTRRLGSPQQPEPPDDAVDMEILEEEEAGVVPDHPGEHAAFGQHDGKGDEQGSASNSEDRGVEEEGGEDDAEDQTGEWRSNDVVCGTCDDGGTLLLCDGTCMRAFHGGVCEVDDGALEDHPCNPMGCSRELFSHIQASNEPFECPNCLARVHQCFVCKKEGASDSSGGAQEVFRCINSSCGRFYHPTCVGRTRSELADSAWVCPAHECHACKGAQSEEMGEIIPCRRCPISYHRRCLPEDLINSGLRRVWIFNPELGPNQEVTVSPGVVECRLERSLLYCGAHAIADEGANPEHACPLFLRELVHAWTLHVGARYEREPWGREMLEREKADRAAWHAAKAAAKGAAVAAAPVRKKKLLKAVWGEAADTAAAAAGKQPKAVAAAAKKLPKAAQAAAMASLEEDTEEMPLNVRAAALLRQKQQKALAATIARPAAPEPAPSTPLFIPLDDEAPPAPPLTAKIGAQELPANASNSQPLLRQRSFVPETRKGARAMHGGEEKAALDRRWALPPQHDTAVESKAEPDQAVSMELDLDADVVGPAGAGSAVEALTQQQQLAQQQQQEAALLPFEREGFWAKATMTKRMSALWEEGNAAVTMAEVRRITRQPEPYNNPSKATITRERLECLSKAVMSASEPKNSARKHLFIDLGNIRELDKHEDNLSLTLAPLLHKDRYTSYGRHFTRHELLKVVNNRLIPLLYPGDTIVDFSAGENSWVPMLKQQCMEEGMHVECRAYDIITPMCLDDFHKETWFDVRMGMLAHGDNLVIGLNPPFGKNGSLANKFVAHAAQQHCPRLIVLIVPPGTVVPPGYCILCEDKTLMQDCAFYVPSKPGISSWNVQAPATRILVREDHFSRVVSFQHEDMEVVREHCFAQVQGPKMAMLPPWHHVATMAPPVVAPQMAPYAPYPMPAGVAEPFGHHSGFVPLPFGQPLIEQPPPDFYGRQVSYAP